MKYLFNDPKTKEPSRKSTYAFLSFFFAVAISIMGLFRAVDTTMVIQLATLFVGLFAALMSLTVWNKKIEK